ncbi:MAG: hypothetical protein AAGF12_21975 [Myxococcota bacterium]
MRTVPSITCGRCASHVFRLIATSALFGGLVFGSATPAAADDPRPWLEQQVDLSFGIGNTLVPQVSYQLHFRLFGNDVRLYLGPGVRVFGTAGSGWRLASENAPGDNFLDGDSSVDAIVANDVFVGSINLGVYLRLALGDHWEIGINTDLIGISFGGSTSGTFIRDGNGEVIPVDDIQPATLSVFPVSGSYNTEMLWVGYYVVPELMIRAGFLFSDYKYRIPSGSVSDPRSDTFERIYPMGLLGMTYTLR